MTNTLRDSRVSDFLLWMCRLRYRFRVRGRSMLPLLEPGDEVLVNPRAYCQQRPQSGDLVVARHPFRTNLKLIKRVSSVQDNDTCWLSGDNPAESTDSATWGVVSTSLIIGRVTSRFR